MKIKFKNYGGSECVIDFGRMDIVDTKFYYERGRGVEKPKDFFMYDADKDRSTFIITKTKKINWEDTEPPYYKHMYNIVNEFENGDGSRTIKYEEFEIPFFEIKYVEPWSKLDGEIKSKSYSESNPSKVSKGLFYTAIQGGSKSSCSETNGWIKGRSDHVKKMIFVGNLAIDMRNLLEKDEEIIELKKVTDELEL